MCIWKSVVNCEQQQQQKNQMKWKEMRKGKKVLIAVNKYIHIHIYMYTYMYVSNTEEDIANNNHIQILLVFMPFMLTIEYLENDVTDLWEFITPVWKVYHLSMCAICDSWT